MYIIKNSIIEFDMRSFIDFEGRWTISPEYIIYLLKTNTYNTVFFNYLDCVDFEISGSESILRYICKTCNLNPGNVIVVVYDPIDIDYAMVFQGYPMSLAHDCIIDTIERSSPTKRFLGLYNRYSLSRVRMSKFLYDNYRDQTILNCNASIDDMYNCRIHDYPDGEELLNWVKYDKPKPSQEISNKGLEETTAMSTEFYNECLMEIVIESNHRIQKVVTEKTMRSFIFGKPFLIFAAPGFLEMLRTIGFKTFHGLIDESYDSIEDHWDRFNFILSEIKRLADMPFDELTSQINGMAEIYKHNKQLLLSHSYQLEKIKWSKTAKFFEHNLLYQ